MTIRSFLCCAAVLLLVCTPIQAQQNEQSKGQKGAQSEQAKKEEPKKPRRKRVVTDLSGFDLLESSKLKKQTMVVGATRGLLRPVALAPRLGKLYGPNPTFAWNYEGKGKNFLFILRDDSQEEVFRAAVTDMNYRYPPDAPALVPGKTYIWIVEPASTILVSPSIPASFLVVSQTQREEIEDDLAQIAHQDPYQAGVARARIFTAHRLWYDALGSYTDLISAHPHRDELYEARGMIYAQLGVTQELAEQDFARADELQQ